MKQSASRRHSSQGAARIPSFTGTAPTTTPANAVRFSALIKSIQHKSLTSGDKETWITFAFDSGNALETINTMNGLHRADALVNVGVWA
jgi:hypothetical protein